MNRGSAVDQSVGAVRNQRFNEAPIHESGKLEHQRLEVLR